jgi:hypothetical protein
VSYAPRRISLSGVVVALNPPAYPLLRS